MALTRLCSGKWVTIAVRVRLNSIGKKDGEMQLWVDGTSAINAKGLVIRGNGGESGVGDNDAGCAGNNGATSRVKGSHFQTFFGGWCFALLEMTHMS